MNIKFHKSCLSVRNDLESISMVINILLKSLVYQCKASSFDKIVIELEDFEGHVRISCKSNIPEENWKD